MSANVNLKGLEVRQEDGTAFELFGYNSNQRGYAMKKNVMLCVFSLLCASTALAGNVTWNKGTWWRDVDLSLTPTNDLEYADSVLRTQYESVLNLSCISPNRISPTDATNVFYRLAVLRGDLEEKKLAVLPRVYVGFGFISDAEERERRNAENEVAIRIRSYQLARKSLVEMIDRAFMRVPCHKTLEGFPVAERNAIVSNLVETARFTPAEAASLGLTNIVENAGQ